MSRRSLGQNFLKDRRTAERIVRALDADEGDSVLEVGPGRGALTRRLAGRCDRLVLVEKDAELAAALEELYVERAEVEVLEGDAVHMDFNEALGSPGTALVVANLPYNAAIPILFNLLANAGCFSRMVLMFQREVAARLTASPGDRNHGALSLLVSARARCRLLFNVPPDCFTPRPKVWSSVVEIEPMLMDGVMAGAIENKEFVDMVHSIHACPRKTVRNSISKGLRVSPERSARMLESAGIDPGVRPCHVTPDQALSLWEVLETVTDTADG